MAEQETGVEKARRLILEHLAKAPFFCEHSQLDKLMRQLWALPWLDLWEAGALLGIEYQGTGPRAEVLNRRRIRLWIWEQRLSKGKESPDAAHEPGQ